MEKFSLIWQQIRVFFPSEMASTVGWLVTRVRGFLSTHCCCISLALRQHAEERAYTQYEEACIADHVDRAFMKKTPKPYHFHGVGWGGTEKPAWANKAPPCPWAGIRSDIAHTFLGTSLSLGEGVLPLASYPAPGTRLCVGLLTPPSGPRWRGAVCCLKLQGLRRHKGRRLLRWRWAVLAARQQ